MNIKIKPLAILIGAVLCGSSLFVSAAENIPSQNTDKVFFGQVVDDIILNGESQTVYGVANNPIIYDGVQLISGIVAIAAGGVGYETFQGEANDTTINGGQQIVGMGVSNNAIINSGGKQVVSKTSFDYGYEIQYGYGTANGSLVNDGGVQSVLAGGTANNTTVYSGGTMEVHGYSKKSTIDGGTQEVFEKGNSESDRIINGGTQLVYKFGNVFDAEIDHGQQSIEEGGYAVGTKLGGGKSRGKSIQNVNGGGVVDTTIHDFGIQYVHSGGVTTNTTIYGSNLFDRGHSYLYAGAYAGGITEINGYGQLMMAAGSEARDVRANGGYLTIIENETSNNKPAKVGNLTMDGGTVFFVAPYKNLDDYASLHISNLNGNGYFKFNTSLAERSANFVTIEQGTGKFGIEVSDSGKEISNHSDLTVNLIHEQGGDIEFEMVTASGRNTRAIDGGTYMYTLFSQQDKDGLSGGNVWYLGALGGGGENPGGENPGGENPGGENPGGENPGGENPGGENPGGENPGGENPGGENPGGENPGGENPGGENPGGENPGGENPGGENPGGENPGGGDNGNAGGNGNGGKKPMTTPATDAILAISNAGLNVIHSELEGLRMYRASLDKTGPESNVWGHYLGSINNIDTSNGAAYKLNQNGMEIGADTRTDFDRGSLITGAFMSYSDNKVKHARGGKSKIESYGLGLYATWFDVSGFYIDGVMKGNRLNNKLSAVMTNGGKTSGDWNQYAFSTAVEGGYQFDLKDDVSITPYARLAFVQMTSEDVKLSNGMKGNTGTPRSVTGEAGAKIAGKFNIGSTEFKPYLSAAVLQEFADSNEVTINERNRFDNNVKGTSGKYGLGASVNVGKDVTLYGEANYRQGSNIETPIQGLAGVRVSF